MSFTLRLAAAAFAALVPAASAHAAEVRATLGNVQAVVWTPDNDDGAQRWPIVVFSHAFGLCPAQARFLTTALAAAGYFVVAPYHADSACDLALDIANAARLPLKPANLWTDADYRDRADDLDRVLGALPGDPAWGPKVDAGRVALLGHSLGGYTVLGLAGAWPSWQTPAGVKAVIAMSPYALPLLSNGALDRLRVPVMFQTGAQDPAFSLPLSLGGGAYERAPAPKLLVEIDYGTHFAWTDAGLFRREAIVGTALAFLDHHVRGHAEGMALETSLEGVSALQSEPPPAHPALARPSLTQRTLATMRGWWRRSLDVWPF